MKKHKCYIFLVLFLFLLIPLNSNATKKNEEISNIEVTYANNPVDIDGYLSEGEWSDAKIIEVDGVLNEIEIGLKQDSKFLYILLSCTAEGSVDIAFNTNNEKSMTIQTDDILMHASDEIFEMNGNGLSWSFSTKYGWSSNIGYGKTFEFKINYSKLLISNGILKFIGAMFTFSSSSEDISWPNGGDIENPSTWGTISSPDYWGDGLHKNILPILSNPKISSTMGLMTDLFNFSIKYQDGNNEFAEKSFLMINGFQYIMKTEGLKPIEGIFYNISIKIRPSNHEHYFLFNDGKNWMRFPEQGNITGPISISGNNPPIFLGIENGTYYIDEDNNIDGLDLIDLEMHFTDDLDDGALKFNIINNSEEVELFLNGSFLTIEQKINNWNGFVEIIIEAIDNGIESEWGQVDIQTTISKPFFIEIIPINDNPVIKEIDGINVEKANVFQYPYKLIENHEILIKITCYDPDLKNNTGLTMVIDNNNFNIEKIDEYWFLYIRPDDENAYRTNVTLIVVDNNGTSDKIEMLFQYYNVNDPPEIIGLKNNHNEYFPIDGIIMIDEVLATKPTIFDIIVKDEDNIHNVQDSLHIFIIDNPQNFLLDRDKNRIKYYPSQIDIDMVEFDLVVQDSKREKDRVHVMILFNVSKSPPNIDGIISSSENMIFYVGDYEWVEINVTNYDLYTNIEEILIVKWKSNIDGELGIGIRLYIFNLSIGKHIIIVNVTDNDNKSSSYQFELTIKIKNENGKITSKYSWIVGIIIILIFINILVFLLLTLKIRITEKLLLDNVNRCMIIDIIRRRPGVNFSSIQKDLNIQIGSLSYHLNVLEKFQLIRSVQDGRYRRFWMYEDKVDLVLKLTSVQEMLLYVIFKNPGISQSKLSMKIGRSRMVVHYNLRILKDIGLILIEKNGRETSCFITNNGTVFVK